METFQIGLRSLKMCYTTHISQAKFALFTEIISFNPSALNSLLVSFQDFILPL